jgi:DNA-binding transcriptional LysR family regulator
MALLDTDQLVTFIAINDTGSHAAAAQRVNKSQSAVSMQMRRLEETIGKPLFRRVGRSNELTAEGEHLLEFAHRIIALNERAVAALTKPELEGRIRIGTPDDYAEQFLPGVLSRFSQSHPRIEVEVVCEVSLRLGERIEQDKLDLAIVNQDVVSGKGQLFRSEQLYWVSSLGHDVHLEPVVPLAMVPEGCRWRQSAEDALDSCDRPYRIAYMSASTLGMNVAVQAGLAVGVMPESAMCPGDLRILREEDGFPVLPKAKISLLRGRNASSPHIEALANHIISTLTNLPNLQTANMAAE